MTFLFDTGSNQLWFPTLQCTSNCASGTTRYNTATSTYFHQLSTKSETIYYGMGQIEGYPCEQQLWLTDYAKVDNMPCLAVFREKNEEGDIADGILGLGPYSRSTGQHSPPFILDILKQNGLIDQRTLFLYLRLDNEQSVIVFGAIDHIVTQKYKSKAVIPIIDLGELYYVPITATMIGDTNLSSTRSRALIDTGTSLLLMPNEIFQSLLKYYKEQDAQLLSCGGFACGFCDNIPKDPLAIELKYYTFRIPFQEVWQIYRGVCFLRVYTSGSNEWILGDIFIRNYAIYIDYDRAEITFYGNDIDPKKENKVPQNLPELDLNERTLRSHYWPIAGLMLISVLFIAVFLIPRVLKQSKEVNPSDQNLQVPLVCSDLKE